VGRKANGTLGVGRAAALEDTSSLWLHDVAAGFPYEKPVAVGRER
jgi:hypothetical protein